MGESAESKQNKVVYGIVGNRSKSRDNRKEVDLKPSRGYSEGGLIWAIY